MTAYKNFVSAVTQGTQVSPESQRAVTEYRAFVPIAELYAERVSDTIALAVLEEAIDNIKSCLQARRSVLS